jgi:hypothetical protein
MKKLSFFILLISALFATAQFEPLAYDWENNPAFFYNSVHIATSENQAFSIPAAGNTSIAIRH